MNCVYGFLYNFTGFHSCGIVDVCCQKRPSKNSRERTVTR